MDNVDPQKKLIEAIKGFDTVMVATKLDDGTTHARPMAVAEVDAQGTVWFVTSRESPKVAEAKADARGLLTAQSSSVFVSVNGVIAFVTDRARIEAMWKPAWKVWFPDGKDDPSITLMRLTPEVGEYWDNSGTKGVRYLYEAAKALVAGEKPQVNGTDQHAKVPL